MFLQWRKTRRTDGCLHNSVNAVFDEFLGIVKALESMKQDAMARAFKKKIKSINFLGKPYIFKYALPHLSALRKTFQITW